MKYKGNEIKYLKKVMDKEVWSSVSGNWVNTFEKLFAQKMGMRYGVAFNSGTSALHAAVLAHANYDDFEVIQPAFTVIMNTFATALAEGEPVYTDIEEDTWNISAKEIKRNITKYTEIIMPVSIYGIHPEMEKIMKIAKEHKLFVIEDNCQCPDKSIADCAVYSFESSKHISTGEGGMLLTNDEAFAEITRKIGGLGYKNLKAEEGRVKLNQDIFQNPHYQRHDNYGYNYRMTEFQAAIGVAQLERYDELISMRRLSGAMYLDVIKGCDYLTPQKVPEGQTHFYWTFPVLYTSPNGKTWEDFRKLFIKNGGKSVYAAWVPPYREAIFPDNKLFFPVTEYVQPRIMQFRTNARTEKEAEIYANALKKTIKEF